MLKIINVPDKRLRLKSDPVEKIDHQLISFVENLSQALLLKTDPPGVGLSAIQVGKPLRIFFSYLPKDKSLPSSKWTPDNLKLELHINPIISRASKKITLGRSKKNPSLEGCLSIPKIYAPVYRHKWVELTYHTCSIEDLSKYQHISEVPVKTTKFTDFPARVMQHEYDHLEGILFTDHTLKSKLPVYMEVDDELVELQDPKAIVSW